MEKDTVRLAMATMPVQAAQDRPEKVGRVLQVSQVRAHLENLARDPRRRERVLMDMVMMPMGLLLMA